MIYKLNSNIVKRIFLILLSIALFVSCSDSQKAIDKLYPDENLDIQYHSKWTKTSYPKRIEIFKNNPLKKGDIVFLEDQIDQMNDSLF